jgi:PAS domain S-box-containing protein
MRFTLSKKIIYTIGMGMLLVSVLLGIAMFIFVGQISREATNNRLKSISHLKSNSINQYLNTRILEIKNTLEKDVIKKDLLLILTQKKDVIESHILLEKIKEQYLSKSNMLDLSLLDKNGTVIASTNEQEIGKIKKEEPLFFESKNEINIYHFNYDFIAKEILTIISIPIKDQNNNTIGVLVEKMDVGAINDIVRNREGLGITGETFLVNSFNYVVTDLLKESNEVLTKSIYLPQVNECLKGNSNYYLLDDYHKDKVYGYARWIPEIKSCLVTKIDKEEIMTPVMQPLPRIVVFFTIILIITLLAGHFVAKSIIEPIKNLRSRAVKIKNGNLNVSIEPETNDEIGDLAVVFKEMLFRLKNVYKGLEDKVKERTSKLEESEKKLKQSLRNSEELSNIVRDSNEPIFSQNIEGKVLSWNIGAENFFGYSAKEMIGKSVDIIIPEDKKSEIENINKIFTSGEKIDRYQTTRKKKDGTIVDVAISASPIKDSRSKISSVSVVVLDITKEKQIDRVKTEFVSIASHQFRAPLSTMNWYVEMLLAEDVGKINEDQKKYLQEISIANKRMVNLVDDLLSVSRLDMGKFVLDITKIDLVKMLDHVIKEFNPQILKKELTISKKYKQKTLNFMGDDKLMHIIYQNLLSNAIKYSLNGGVLEVGLSKVRKGQKVGGRIIDIDSVIFSVSDQGVGIPNHQKDKVFSKLFRADNIRKSEPDGTGLGLYVVKSIADQSDGSVWFASEENRGSTFYVGYPAKGMRDKLDEGEKPE